MYHFRNAFPVDLFEAVSRGLDAFQRSAEQADGELKDRPAMNVWTNEETVAVTAELPGVQADDLHIDVEGDTLTVSGQRTVDVPEGAQVLRQERSSRRLSRTLRLPFAIDSERTEAQLGNGVLKITLHRRSSDKPHRVHVKT